MTGLDIQLIVLDFLLVIGELDGIISGKQQHHLLHQTLLNGIIPLLFVFDLTEQLPIIDHQNDFAIQQSRQPSNIHIVEVLELQSEESGEEDGPFFLIDHNVVGGEV
jgi:hypothetical protein